MAKPDRALNLALAQLDRPAWPTTLPDFGVDPILPLAETTSISADEAMRQGLVHANRMTCKLTFDRYERFAAAANPRTLIIHAVDAEPAVPLLLYWLLRNTDAVLALAGRVRQELSCELLFALPADVPDRLRRLLSKFSPVRWVDARYPGGHWRLMPRATRISASSSLTLDVIAAIDWAEAMKTGVAAGIRPIVVGLKQTISYRAVARSSPIDDLLDSNETTTGGRWFKGPRLSDCITSDEESIADGELTFYREARGDRSASACIRCGNCLAICPTRVDPVGLLRASIRGIESRWRNESSLRRVGLDSCIECGLCTAVCPSGIELHHAFAILKAEHAEHPHV